MLIGLPVFFLPAVFVMFFQFDGSSNRKKRFGNITTFLEVVATFIGNFFSFIWGQKSQHLKNL